MRIGGFQKLTLVDFPGKIAATVFTQGCNFRCAYCHNPELVIPQLFQVPLSSELVLDYLKSRQGQLEGVVVSGGEPTLQQGLVDFLVRIKAMGFAVKLDTNGSNPDILSSLMELKLLDYIAMDIKTSLKRYHQVTCLACDTSKIQASSNLIIRSGIKYQFRTTLVKEFCSPQNLSDIAGFVATALAVTKQSPKN